MKSFGNEKILTGVSQLLKSTNACVQAAAVQEGELKAADNALALALKLGEATVQLQLTVGDVKAMTLERMVHIWKVCRSQLQGCV